MASEQAQADGSLRDAEEGVTGGGDIAGSRQAHGAGRSKDPVLNNCLGGRVHTGIWDSYEVGVASVVILARSDASIG